MFRLVRFFITLAVLVIFIWFGATVDLGKHTLFGHVRRIWKSDEAQDLVEGTKDKAGPAVDRLKRGVETGVKAAKEDPDAAPKRKRRRE